MFSDNKTQVSRFTTSSNITFGDIGTENKSKILKKNPVDVDKIQSKVIKKGKTVAAVRPVKKHKAVEKKLEINGKVEVVNRRRRNRRNIQEELGTGTQENQMVIEENSGDQHLNIRSSKGVVKMPEEGVNQNDESDEEEESEDEEDDEEDSNSEYDSEENLFSNQIKRPVFISKDQRYAQALELQTELKNEIEKNRRKRAIKEQNKQIVVEAKSKRVVEETDQYDSDYDLPNDDDDDEDTAYEKWKIRELQRLKRDREKREQEFREREQTERRRLMTDEERAKEDKKIGKYKEEQKSNYQFMQKYYHMGVFVSDPDDPIFKRDYNIGVGTDNFDKSGLRKSLQVRRGEEHKRGKSKYTHLGDEDTTNFDPDWQMDENLRAKAMKRMGGYKSYGAFDRPSKKNR